MKQAADLHCPLVPQLEKQAPGYTGSAPATTSGAETCTLNCPLGNEAAAAGNDAVQRHTLDYQHCCQAHSATSGLAAVSIQFLHDMHAERRAR